jgi:hypothetical protein
MTTPAYALGIDWNADGDWSDTGEQIFGRVSDVTGITCSRGRTQIRELAPPVVGRFDADLTNTSKDYSTEYASSPLAGNLLPGRRVDWRAVWSATTYRLWSGILDDIPQRPVERRVGIPCLGTLSRLAGKKVTTAAYQSITTDAAIGHVLDAVGWPAGERSLQTGATTLAWWWLDDEDAFSALVRLMNTEGPGAIFYERGDGYFVFENRHNRLTATRSTVVQGTFSDQHGAALHHGLAFDLDAHLKDVINSVAIPVNLRTAQALAEVWALGATLVVPAGGATQIVVSSSDGNPFTAAVAPVLTTDYTLISGTATLTLDRTSGRTATLTVTAGASGATITGLRVRAQLLTKVAVQVINTTDCSASIAKFGVRPLSDSAYPIWPEIDLQTAQDFANAIASRYRDPRATATISVYGRDDTHLAQCLGREIGDRIHVLEGQSGLDADMTIERVEHRLDTAGRRLTTKFGCEKVSEINQYAAWGSAVWDASAWAW